MHNHTHGRHWKVTKQSTFEPVSSLTCFCSSYKPIHLYWLLFTNGNLFLADSCNGLPSTGYPSKLPQGGVTLLE